MRIQKTLINTLLGFTLVSVSTSAFAFVHVGQIFCNINGQEGKINNVTTEYIDLDIHSLPVVSFDGLKPVNYIGAYHACYKKYKEGSFTIDHIPRIDESGSLDNFMKSIDIVNKFKLYDFVEMSVDGFSDFNLFKRDVPKTSPTYIMLKEPNKVKIDTPDKDIALALFSSKKNTWNGKSIFKQTGTEVETNNIPTSASATLDMMETILENKFTHLLGGRYSSTMNPYIAKFIMITANQSAFDGLIEGLVFGTTGNQKERLFPSTNDKRANYYQIIPAKLSDTQAVVEYTQVLEFTNIQQIGPSYIKEIKLEKPVTVAISATFTLKNMRNLFTAEINHSEYKVKISGGSDSDKKLMNAIIKGGILMTNPGFRNTNSNYTIGKTKNISIRDN